MNKAFSIGGELAFNANPTLKALQETEKVASNLTGVLVNLGVTATKLAGDFEANRNALAVFAGGANLAQRELTALDKAARNTAGLRLTQAEAGYAQLRALNFEAKTATNLIIGLGKQKTLNPLVDEMSVQRVVTNLTQMSTSTDRFAADLQQIFHSMGSMRTAFFEAFGTLDTQKLKKFFEDDPDKAMEKLADAMAKTKGAAGGFNTSIISLENAWLEASRAFGTPLLDELVEDTNFFTKTIQENEGEFKRWGISVADTIRGVRKVAAEEEVGSKSKSVVGFVSSIGKFINQYNPAYQGVKHLQKRGAEERQKQEATKDMDGGESVFKYDPKAAMRQAQLEEKARTERIAGINQYQETASALYKDFYSVQSAMLDSYLNNTVQDEIVSLKQHQSLKTSQINNEIKLQNDSFNKLINLEKDDKDAVSKLKAEKSKVISGLNAELKVSELKTQKEIADKERQILNQRRQDTIEFYQLNSQIVQKNLDKQTFDIQKFIGNSVSLEEDSFNQLIEITNKGYQELLQQNRNALAEQLKDKTLSEEKISNIKTQFSLEEVRLTEDNRRKIIQIEEDKKNKILSFWQEIYSSASRLESMQNDRQGKFLQTMFNSDFASSKNLSNVSGELKRRAADIDFGTKLYHDALHKFRQAEEKLSDFRKDKGYDAKTGNYENATFPDYDVRDRLEGDVAKTKKVADSAQANIDYLKSNLSDYGEQFADFKSLLNQNLGDTTIFDQIDAKISKLNFDSSLISLNHQIEAAEQAFQKDKSITNTSALVLLKDQRGNLIADYYQKQQEMQRNAISGLKEYLSLIKSGDAVVNLAFKANAEKNLLKDQIGSYQEIYNLKERIANIDSFNQLEIEKAQLNDIINLRTREADLIIRANTAQSQASELWKFSYQEISTGILENIANQQSLNDTMINGAMQIPSLLTDSINRSNGTIQGFFKQVAIGFGEMTAQILADLAKMYFYKALFNLIAGAVGSGVSSNFAGGASTLLSNNSGGNASAMSIASSYFGGKAAGGLISGPGSGTSDSILAHLSNGEYVNKASSVDYYGAGLFSALNQQLLPKDFFNAPKFADGGMLSNISPSPIAPSVNSSSTANSNNKTTNVINVTVNANKDGGSNAFSQQSSHQIARQIADVIAQAQLRR